MRGESPVTKRRRRTILVVDDDAAILLAISDVLHAEGYPVITTRDGESALKIAERRRPSLILLDIRMPGLNGVDLAQELRARRIAAKIVVMTTPDASHVAEEIGADGYLEKPFGVTSLLRSLDCLTVE